MDNASDDTSKFGTFSRKAESGVLKKNVPFPKSKNLFSNANERAPTPPFQCWIVGCQDALRKGTFILSTEKHRKQLSTLKRGEGVGLRMTKAISRRGTRGTFFLSTPDSNFLKNISKIRVSYEAFSQNCIYTGNAKTRHDHTKGAEHGNLNAMQLLEQASVFSRHAHKNAG